MSFEPIRSYAAILEALAVAKNPQSDLERPACYDYCITGLSDVAGEIEFVTPVIDGKIVSALTTANKSPHIECLAQNIFDYIVRYLPGGTAEICRLYPFKAPVVTLDSWVKTGNCKVSLTNIVALKIDTEGYEGHVISGASELLTSQKPLIMAECGHINELACKTAHAHGYRLAEREGDQLIISDKVTQKVNGFFVHPEQVPFYRHIGLMKA